MQVISPYDAPSGPTLRESVVCFLDVLGYREFFGEDISFESQGETLRQFHQAIKSASEWMDWWKEPEATTPVQQPFVLKSFTDNIVIAWPIDRDGEHELGTIIDHVADFQVTMSTRGFFVRGAVAVGPCYVDDLGVFGSGVLEAYRGESVLARDPRVVIMPSARAYIEQHLGYYPYQESAPQNTDLRRDADGQWFVNYLANLIIEEDHPGGVGFHEVELHRDLITQRLQRYAQRPRLWSKYEWLARYHNHFCREWRHLFDETYLVPLEEARASISSIIRPE